MDKQTIGLAGVPNARELGGYSVDGGKTIKHGSLLRTGRLERATSEDISRLREKFSVGAVVDFRMEAEADDAPDPEINGAEYYHIGILNEAELIKQQEQMGVDMLAMYSDPIRFFRMALELRIVQPDMYVDFLKSEVGKAGFGRFLRIAVEMPQDRALLWHCTSGKDRTGIAAMLLLTLLGAAEETILYDFMLTNEYNAERIAKTRAFLEAALDDFEKPRIHDMLVVLDGVNEKYMKNALEFMRREYGSTEGYIKAELGISDNDIEILKAKYLE